MKNLAILLFAGLSLLLTSCGIKIPVSQRVKAAKEAPKPTESCGFTENCDAETDLNLMTPNYNVLPNRPFRTLKIVGGGYKSGPHINTVPPRISTCSGDGGANCRAEYPHGSKVTINFPKIIDDTLQFDYFYCSGAAGNTVGRTGIPSPTIVMDDDYNCSAHYKRNGNPVAPGPGTFQLSFEDDAYTGSAIFTRPTVIDQCVGGKTGFCRGTFKAGSTVEISFPKEIFRGTNLAFDYFSCEGANFNTVGFDRKNVGRIVMTSDTKCKGFYRGAQGPTTPGPGSFQLTLDDESYSGSPIFTVPRNIDKCVGGAGAGCQSFFPAGSKVEITYPKSIHRGVDLAFDYIYCEGPQSKFTGRRGQNTVSIALSGNTTCEGFYRTSTGPSGPGPASYQLTLADDAFSGSPITTIPAAIDGCLGGRTAKCSAFFAAGSTVEVNFPKEIFRDGNLAFDYFHCESPSLSLTGRPGQTTARVVISGDTKCFSYYKGEKGPTTPGPGSAKLKIVMDPTYRGASVFTVPPKIQDCGNGNLKNCEVLLPKGSRISIFFPPSVHVDGRDINFYSYYCYGAQVKIDGRRGDRIARLMMGEDTECGAYYY